MGRHLPFFASARGTDRGNQDEATVRTSRPLFEPTIRTRRLTLRPLGADDVDDIVATIGDIAVSRNLARVPHPYSRRDAQAFLTFARRLTRERRSLMSAIVRQGRVIGVVSIDAVPYRNRLGYWLNRDAWGHGYATEAVAALAAYAFEVIGLRLIRSGIFVDNLASLRVQTKLGFRPTSLRWGWSLARGERLQHTGTVLIRARFEEALR